MIKLILETHHKKSTKFTMRESKISTKESKKISDEEEKIELIVKDNGIGMKQENIDKIFNADVFSSPGTEKELGTGLGLQLIIQFIEKNCGTLKIERIENEGSTFIITLPSTKSP